MAMDKRHEQFLTLYHSYRHKEQSSWYEDRCVELERAQRQATYASRGLIFLAMIASIFTTLATTELMPFKWIWVTLSVFFPALSTAVAAYSSLYAFDQQLKLYKDAARGLHRAEAEAFKLQTSTDKANYRKNVEAYVDQVEVIFRKEQGQWGQLISEIKTVEPPKTDHEA